MARSKALEAALGKLALAKTKHAEVMAKKAAADKAEAAYSKVLDAQRKTKLVYVNTAGNVSESNLAAFTFYMGWNEAKPKDRKALILSLSAGKVDTGQGGQVKVASLAKRIRLFTPAAIRQVASIDRRMKALAAQRRAIVESMATEGTEVDVDWLTQRIADKSWARYSGPVVSSVGITYDMDRATRELADAETHVAHLRKSATETPDTCPVCKGMAQRREWERLDAERAKQRAKDERAQARKVVAA